MSLLQVEHLDIPEAVELRKLRLLKEELGELAAQGEQQLLCPLPLLRICGARAALRWFDTGQLGLGAVLPWAACC